MGLNLHAIVRGAINAVNPDILGQWLESSGAATGADFRQTPGYAFHDGVHMQVQALKGRDLQHPALLSVQGVTRAVYMFGTVQGVSKPQAKGGDILQFRMVDNGPYLRWLVVAELEQWNPSGAWCKVAVVLQTDAATGLVPDLVDEFLPDAQAAITAAGFVLGSYTTAPSDTVPFDFIISQSPAPGTLAAYGAGIAIVSSTGPEVDV